MDFSVAVIGFSLAARGGPALCITVSGARARRPAKIKNTDEEIFRSGTSMGDPNVNIFASLANDVAACHHRWYCLMIDCVKK
jgi:hypothetical protein